MAAKLLRTMSDDNSDVPKHIGCMSGIFHLFGRGHFLSRRHVSKRQPPAAAGNNNTSSTTSTHNNQSSVPPTDPPKPTNIINPVQKGRPNNIVKDSILYRDVRGISVKRGSSTKQESGTLTYIDSPRPSLPSPKSTKSKLYGFRESLPPPADSRFLHRKESPRFSYDGRESKPSCFKIKELPRYSLDSKRPTTTPPLSQEEEEDGTRSHRRQPSIVAKLMGLEDLEHQLDPVSQEEYDPISRPEDKKSTLPNSRRLELAPWKRPELGTTVYGQIEKRLSHLEFQKSGKDLRALKQILQAMQNCEPNKLQSDDDTLLNSAPTINRIGSPPPPPPKKKKQSKPPTFAIKPTKKAESSSVVPVPGLRKLDLGDKKRVQKKQSQPSLESRSPRQQKTNRPESAKRIINQSRQVKSKSKAKPKGGSNRLGSDNSSSCGDLTEQSNSISVQSDSINSQEEMEVSSPYIQERKKMASRIREDDFISKRHTPEQPSPVSVLDAFDDEPPSPVRMIKRDTKPLNNNKTRNDHDSSLGIMDLSPVKPIQHDKEINKSRNYGYISEILLASGLLNGAKSKYMDETLVSDVVNELLIEKMTSNRSVTQQKQLLKTLCTEIEELPCKLDEEDNDCFRKMLEKDLGRRSMDWKLGFGDSTGIVVDMERMIFRDLICEMVSSEAMDLQARYVKSRRQLFQN